MTYQDTIEYLYSQMPSFQDVGAVGYKPGLERMRSISSLLSDPHLCYPTIHIAGTNGKGSSSHMLASVLASAGYRVGLFTSPHLRDFRERIRINGEMISESEVCEFVEQNRAEMERVSLSFFEMTASMAFAHFARHGVDVAVIETGLGGRLDATNIVESALSLITNIGLDHTQYLGETIPEVAAEKAGIIKSGQCVVITERGEESDPIFEQRAKDMGSKLLFAEDRYELRGRSILESMQRVELLNRASGRSEHYDLDLMGVYQQKNLRGVLTAIDVINDSLEIDLNIPSEAIVEGLRDVVGRTSLLGRWQHIDRDGVTIICDTAHNIEGLTEVAESLRSESFDRLICVFGSTQERDHVAMLRLFDIAEVEYIATRAKGLRSTPAEVIAEDMRRAGYHNIEAVEGVSRALQRAVEIAKEGDLIFVGGSNFVVAEIL